MSTVKLGGRDLQTMGISTLAHEIHVQRLIRDAGINDVTMREGEAPADFVTRLIDAVYDSGKLIEIVGALMAPASLDLKEWTPAVAEDVTAFLAQLTSKEDKEAFRGMVASILLGFFQSGLVSFWTSATSSSKSGNESGLGGPESRSLSASHAGA